MYDVAAACADGRGWVFFRVGQFFAEQCRLGSRVGKLQGGRVGPRQGGRVEQHQEGPQP